MEKSHVSLIHDPSLSRWYESSNSSNDGAFATARTAFEEALNIFKQQLTNDAHKKQQVDQLHASSLQDIVDAVAEAQRIYESQRKSSKTRQYLTAFSKRVSHYGNVMDVMVQHHPEYVALAWGLMKVLFGVSVT